MLQLYLHVGKWTLWDWKVTSSLCSWPALVFWQELSRNQTSGWVSSFVTHSSGKIWCFVIPVVVLFVWDMYFSPLKETDIIMRRKFLWLHVLCGKRRAILKSIPTNEHEFEPMSCRYSYT